jgi:catechol 2,3-dioxygenase-like lactoylglutathione lyase family enzyme
VRAFHQAALAIGAEVLHAPRLFREYHEHCFAAFIRDPDGHNIEAVCGLPEG